MNPPKHAFEITLRAGANDWQRALDEAARLYEELGAHGPECNLTSGLGYVYVEKRDVTEAVYREELEAWRLAERQKANP